MKRDYTRNKMLVSVGEIWSTVFYIHQGLIRLFYTDKEGREFNKGFFGGDQLVKYIYPLQTLRESKDIANMVVFLASDQAKWITGGIIPVDGGLTTN